MNRNIWIGITVLVFVGLIFLIAKEDGSKNTQQALPTLAPSVTISQSESLKDGDTNNGSESASMQDTNDLKVEDLKVGTGVEAKSGSRVTVNYKGVLTNGTQFDSSYDLGEPFSFNLGAGEVIAGWDRGVAGMKVGGKRKLTIPADLAYGARALPDIPANSTLIFEVELLEVE